MYENALNPIDLKGTGITFPFAVIVQSRGYLIQNTI
jgi:hypothetical protein